MRCRAGKPSAVFLRGESQKDRLPVLWGVTFLAGKKVTKEPTQGRLLTAKPFAFAEIVVALYPDFELPSPENPSRPLRANKMLSSRFYPPASPGDILFAAAHQ